MKIVFSLSITVDSEDLPESVQTPDAAKASLEDFDFAALISDLANDAEGE